MANLKESSFWEEGIYQWETSDPVLGGENGIDNVPTRQLANRTKWLKDNKLDKSATAASADLAKKAQVADKLSKARNVGGVAFDGSVDIDLPGVNKPGNQNTSGNAATASYAAQIAARKIGGVIFNAKTDIDLPGVNIKGNQDTSGNAATATRLQTICTINGVSFDGSADINATPAGAIQFFAMEIAPVGWLKANGAELSRVTYANLYAAIGTRFGAGDGKTTFNLPDLRGEFLRGWDDGRGLDRNRIFASIQLDSVQNWTAGFTYQRAQIRQGYEPMEGGYTLKERSGVGLGFPLKEPAGWSVGFGVLGPGINNVARTSTETRPHNISLLACIKI
ncbi:hypothetical protein BGI05_03255 [Snodgrassella alvi]|uniref:phage tail protein n=1 Tax=Snodgrassella alvi TaxID=1196083 RepID=UPI000A05D2C2|nr:phage tail protein [Snodgrassella alvi]ORF01661.1 hypothetical protein BGH97_06700 [Snodgrassella alvi]ORF08993.1 hypothetical protein BGH99_03840 [Snodgrassella alvi]ORF11547.1 hypothetical protein BGI00_07330 [Snodgrassella alvi]ORF13569.1 hypothetical protein BGI02_06835 [Snodgrassella alvi]ORF21937.1 hypothetical protein BGI05_03255 [Snodgrassella alvi]